MTFLRLPASSAPIPTSVLIYILHSGNLYGTERMALATLQGMDEYDERVVFAPADAGRGSVAEAARRAGFRAVTFKSRADLLRLLLPWFVRHRNIDVMGTGVVHSFVCHALGRLFGVRLRQVHVAHGGTANSLARKNALNRLPVKLVAVSEFVRQKLIERGVLADKITVIENFLSDADATSPLTRPAYDPAVPGSRSVDPHRIKVAIVSRVDAFKRIDVLVESSLPNDFPEFEFDVYGTGDQFDRLTARSAVMPNVTLHGFVPDVEQRLSEADILLHLCPEEPFGLVILEAFRARIVVVGPASGGVGQLIDEGRTGLRFEANDSDDLGRVLRQIRSMTGPQLQRIADAGAQKLREQFNQDVGVRLYRSAMASAGPLLRGADVPARRREGSGAPIPRSPGPVAFASTASDGARPQILCLMRMPPDPDGHGGSQRAWRLLQALLPHGTVHFVLMYREQDRDCMDATLDKVKPLVASVTRLRIDAWQPSNKRRLGFIPGRVSDIFTMGSQDAPQFTDEVLRSIADRLPCRDVDIVFAGRLCCATVAQSLIDRKLLAAGVRAVDFDDIMSKFTLRQVRSTGLNLGLYRRATMLVDAWLVGRAESRIADEWHAVSVCTDADVVSLMAVNADRVVEKIPNVVQRRRLPARTPDGRFDILFTGNLGFAPNIDGLRLFVAEAWPRLVAEVPGARLVVVGLNPGPALVDMVRAHGFELHSNVPSLEPFYARCDAVIAPILFGSGTRIKILEAMAYGRPVVSTTVGAEGMALENGRHVLLADRMDDFADALVTIAKDPVRAAFLAEEAHRFQQTHYTPAAFDIAVDRFLQSGRDRAAVPA